MKKLGIFVCMLAIVTLFAACGDTTQKTDSDATTVPSASESVDNKVRKRVAYFMKTKH